MLPVIVIIGTVTTLAGLLLGERVNGGSGGGADNGPAVGPDEVAPGVGDVGDNGPPADTGASSPDTTNAEIAGTEQQNQSD